jgi:adenylate cyclase
MEKIAGRLGRTVVASEVFANVCNEGWRALGEFPIAGFSKAQLVYGLAEETPVVMA